MEKKLFLFLFDVNLDFNFLVRKDLIDLIICINDLDFLDIFLIGVSKGYCESNFFK